jgi:hypothetical protein
MVIVRGNGLDVVALALGLSSDRPAAIDRLLRTLSLGRRRPDGKCISNQDSGDAPGRNGAARIAVECLAESLFALGKPEGMQATPRSKLS